MKPCIRTHSGDAMIIGSTNISSPAPAITGQTARIAFAKALRQDAKVPPLNRLTAESATKELASVSVGCVCLGIGRHVVAGITEDYAQ